MIGRVNEQTAQTPRIIVLRELPRMRARKFPRMPLNQDGDVRTVNDDAFVAKFNA